MHNENLTAAHPVREILASGTPGSVRVSVVIPLYNYAHLVTETLDSVSDQTLDAIELVVVDDASTDQSLDVARDWLLRHRARFPRVLLLAHETNAGLATARNTGVRHSSTSLFLPLDADNILYPRCLEALEGALTRAPEAAFAYPLLEVFEAGRGVMGAPLWDPVRLAKANYIDAMALIRKEAWRAVSGYSDMRGWEDYEFWCRLHEEGRYGIQVPNVLARYRLHYSSMLRTLTNTAENHASLLAEMRRRHPWMLSHDRSSA
jgi:glycosyltransferase involved in cell wall biosynthesis